MKSVKTSNLFRGGVDRLSSRAKSSWGHQFRVIGTFLEGGRESNVWKSLFVTQKVKKFTLWPFVEKVCHFLIWIFEPCLAWLAVLHAVFSSLLPLTNLSPGFSLSEHLVQEAPIIKSSPKGQEMKIYSKWKSIALLFFISFPPLNIKLTEALVCLELPQVWVAFDNF